MQQGIFQRIARRIADMAALRSQHPGVAAVPQQLRDTETRPGTDDETHLPGDSQHRLGAADVARQHFHVRSELGTSAAAALSTYHSNTPCGLMSCTGYGGIRRPFIKLRMISALFSPLTSITT